MSGAIPVITQPEVGENLWFGGGLITFKVTSEQSGGAFCMYEYSASKGKMTPLHLHADSAETTYVFEGELRLLIDGVEYVAGPGAVVSVPRGIPHAFVVNSEVVRALIVATPGEPIEAFTRQAGDVAENKTLPPPETDIPRIMAAGAATGAMKFLGPPPFPQPQHA